MFIPRLSSDGMYNNPLWYSDNPFYQSGYGLPNCTCYAYGRFWEEEGVKPSLPLGDAGDWFPEVVRTGIYPTGTTPKLGAVACYAYPGRAGHVAIVEQINPDGSFVISQSNYKRPISSYPPDMPDYFFLGTCDKDSKKSPWLANFTFQGFIYASEQSYDWISKNVYLSTSEQQNNALVFWYYMGAKGVSLNAVAAMLGNMETESTINPGIWESLKPYSGGYGLVQWTPYTKYSEWAGSSWENNGNKECDRILYEADNGLQWFANPNAPVVNPPISFSDFLKSEQDVGTLANYFLWYYEHPAVTIQPNRAEQAEKWFAFLKGAPPPKPTRRKKMPLYMMIRRRL